MAKINILVIDDLHEIRRQFEEKINLLNNFIEIELGCSDTTIAGEYFSFEPGKNLWVDKLQNNSNYDLIYLDLININPTDIHNGVNILSVIATTYRNKEIDNVVVFTTDLNFLDNKNTLFNDLPSNVNLKREYFFKPFLNSAPKLLENIKINLLDKNKIRFKDINEKIKEKKVFENPAFEVSILVNNENTNLNHVDYFTAESGSCSVACRTTILGYQTNYNFYNSTEYKKCFPSTEIPNKWFVDLVWYKKSFNDINKLLDDLIGTQFSNPPFIIPFRKYWINVLKIANPSIDITSISTKIFINVLAHNGRIKLEIPFGTYTEEQVKNLREQLRKLVISLKKQFFQNFKE